VTAALLTGALGLGIGAWSLVAPVDPQGVVSSLNVTPTAGLILVGLCMATGFVAYFAGWPYGRHIGLLAVPAGLAVWAIRSQDVFKLIQGAPTVPERLETYGALRWDSLFWLGLVGAGLAGVWIAKTLCPAPEYTDPLRLSKTKTKAGAALDLALAPLLGLAASHILTCILARGNGVIGASLPTQPACAQIAFAVMVAFGVAAFLTGRFLRGGLFWPIVVSAALPIVNGLAYARAALLEPIGSAYPATCFPVPLLAILPVQVVAFGALGTMAGYWMAVRLEHWHTHPAA
jgi:hypothetical protein